LTYGKANGEKVVEETLKTIAVSEQCDEKDIEGMKRVHNWLSGSALQDIFIYTIAAI